MDMLTRRAFHPVDLFFLHGRDHVGECQFAFEAPPFEFSVEHCFRHQFSPFPNATPKYLGSIQTARTGRRAPPVGPPQHQLHDEPNARVESREPSRNRIPN